MLGGPPTQVLPRGDYTSVAGLMLEALDHVPEAGESVEVGATR